MNEAGRYEVPTDQRSVSGFRPEAGGVVTERDLAMLGWIARFPCVSIDLLRRWLVDVAGGGRADSIIYGRLQLLTKVGLVTSERILATTSRAVWATADGLRAVGHVGRSVPPRLGTFEHDLMVAWLALRFTVDKPTHQLVTEREMRAWETPNQLRDAPVIFTTVASTAAGTTGAAGTTAAGQRERRVYPDLVTVAPSGAHVVHEVERTGKERRRMEQLMLAHLMNDNVKSIRYYARRGFLIERLGAAAEKALDIAASRGKIKPLTIVEYTEKAT